MNVYEVKYIMTDNKEYTCNILGDSSNDVTTFLKLLYPRKIKNIHTISGDHKKVNGITDSIINRILVKYGHRDEDTINPIIKD